ncbi:dethiobiotin synthase [Rodentibacter heidelbergensis]|uniref:ATP-dependent dethiobiotin synthetase BioD n=1 Tax=Rodentibacter heidelbergensis TaxID=1908258 RepID=A0A1V3ICK8_9PAST|nr:dethiobiotin synthase [Rodentibacter heidelbergensis]OOF37829.1 dethiobiotin synthase [Rodentibacter heidelbergensis]
MNSFFITGTDTNVGKTTACRAIIQALQDKEINIVGFKPIACSAEETHYVSGRNPVSDYENKENSDVLILMDSTEQNVTYEEINSYTFNHSLPMLVEEKARIKLDKINQMLDKLCHKYQAVAVEGAFGLLTPMTEGKGFADWVKERKMPIILVVGIKDGCISHALLTVQAIRSLGVPLLGWVANRVNPLLSHYAEIIEFLEKNIDAPLLGKIPYIHKPESQELGQYLTNIDHLLSLYTEQTK